MIKVEFLIILIAVGLLMLTVLTYRSMFASWGDSGREAELCKFPKAIITFPQFCHFCFVLIVTGLGACQLLLLWLVLLEVFNNYMHIDFD